MNTDRLALAFALAVAVAAAPALALGEDPFENECTTDADCGGGLACVAETYELCYAGADENGNPTEPVCETHVVSACRPKACTSDAECTGGTSCVTFSYEACEDEEPLPGGADEGGASGDAADGCETVTESYCVPPWMAPCTVDADCGPGFTCEPELSCWSDGGTRDPDDPAGGGAGGTSETCTPTGVSRCEYVPTRCDVDADCAAGLGCEDFSTWVCEDEPDSPPVPDDDGAGGAGGELGGGTGAGGAGAAGGAGGEETGAGGTGPCVEETSYCVPPGFLAWMAAGGGDVSDGMEDGESLGGGSQRGNADEDGGGDSGGGSGCTSAGGGVSLLGLLGVALLLRRRR